MCIFNIFIAAIIIMVIVVGMIHIDNYRNDYYQVIYNGIMKLTNKIFKKN